MERPRLDPDLAAAIQERRRESDRRLDLFSERLRETLEPDITKLVGEHTCVYAIGSAGRGELTPESDLDLFIVRCDGEPSRLDAVQLQAAIVRASRLASFPDPSDDGQWLTLHTADRFVSLLGSPADDSENTFTARMLLLLESRLVLGQPAYEQTLEKVIDAYWRNEAEHPNDYQPIVLINDIIRYWRILLLNYEATNTRRQRTAMDEEARDARRRLRSYRLRFSRCLTCYSALAYLLALTHGVGKPHVERQDVKNMVASVPLDRLLWVRERASAVSGVPETVDRLLTSYRTFLAFANQGRSELERQFRDSSFRSSRSREGQSFGEDMFQLVSHLGERNPLYRWLVV